MKELIDLKETLNNTINALKTKVIKTGILNCNLYNTSMKGFTCEAIVTEQERKTLTEEYLNSFELFLRKGTKFVCRNTNGQERWSPDNNIYEFEFINEEWVKYLEDIQEVKENEKH